MNRAFGCFLLAATAASSPPPAPAPVHTDGRAVERGILDATKALLYGNATDAREALDRVEASCRTLAYDESPAWPRAMVDQDVGLHAALTRAREYSSRSMWEDAANSLVWVERSCRTCHALRPTSPSPSGSESPTPPSGSTP